MDQRSRPGAGVGTPIELFTVDVRTDVTVISGELDHTTCGTLRDALDPLTRAGGDVWIDAAEITFIGCAGLGVLTEAATALGPAGRIIVVEPSRVVERAIDLVGLAPEIDVVVAGRHRIARPSPIARRCRTVDCSPAP